MKEHLKIGDRLVMDADGDVSLEDRTVTIAGETFGCSPFTMGTALWVRFKDGREGRMCAMEIERRADVA